MTVAEEKKKYRFLFIQPFELSTGGRFADKYHSAELSKEKRLRMEYLNIRPLLADVDWDFHGGPTPPYGDWAVETREEFAHVAAARLPIVREACESGKYNAIILLGGGEPGFMESREIARKYGIPVTEAHDIDKNRLVVSLDNGHWAYGEQLSLIKHKEEV